MLDILLDHLAVDQWEDFTNREKYLAVTLATCHSVLVKGGLATQGGEVAMTSRTGTSLCRGAGVVMA